MYPLNMTKPGDQPGYALANDEAEHAALSDLGYEPKLVEEVVADSTEETQDAPKRRGRPPKA